MKKTSVKIIGLCLSVVLIIVVIPTFAIAESNNHVYSDKVIVESGSTISVPIYISNNTGFMGISVVFSYDSSVLTPVSVSKGELITTGLFDDSIGTTDKDEFKVIWCGSEDILSDGEICVLKFNVSDDFLGESKITVTYENKNTFDKYYNSLKLNCEEIVVSTSSAEEPVELTFWQKIAAWFKKVWNWITGLFVKW